MHSIRGNVHLMECCWLTLEKYFFKKGEVLQNTRKLGNAVLSLSSRRKQEALNNNLGVSKCAILKDWEGSIMYQIATSQSWTEIIFVTTSSTSSASVRNGSGAYFWYQILPVPVSVLIFSTKSYQYRFWYLFLVPNFTGTGFGTCFRYQIYK